MKKLLLITMLVATASMFTACDNTDLAQGYGELEVTESQVSCHTSDLDVLVFTRADYDIFEEYPF